MNIHAIIIYNIVSIDNLNSILKNGILSHNASKRLNHNDISNHDVQNRREKVIINNKALHDYVNLYFNPRNAMLYSRLSMIDNLCILVIDKTVLNYEDTIVTDRNAAVGGAKFLSPSDALKKLNFDIIYSKSWEDDDADKKIRLKAQMMAEILVSNTISSELIKEIWVGSEQAFQKVKNICKNVKVTQQKYAFFR